MASRLIPTIFTFIVLVSGYLAYDTLAVPALFGPPAAAVNVIQPAAAQTQQSSQLFSELIHPIFPEGSWERQCQIVLRNEQIMLFVGGYEQLDDHRLQIAPCTIVLRPQGLNAASGPDNRTWIMQSPAKTILQMERDADIRRGSLGRIVSAYIPGEVNVRCDESQPGAGDQVELATTHLQISAQQIWTPHDVRFRWGTNFGMGSDLTIRFSDLQASSGQHQHGKFQKLPQALPAGLRSIELVRLARLHIETPRGNSNAGQMIAAQPIEVMCSGPLKLDMMGGLARMNQDVKIERFLPGGQVDALSCDELTARFAYARSADSGETFQLERVVAVGQPATVTSARVTASPADTTTPSQMSPPQHRFDSARLEYDLATGEFSSGPGRYTTRVNRALGKSPDRALAADAAGQEDQIVEVVWQRRMRMQAAESGQQITLEGPARCTFGANEIVANQLRMWFEQSSPPASLGSRLAMQPTPTGTNLDRSVAHHEPKLRPRRITADGRVRINMEQLVGSTEKLDVILRRTEKSQELASSEAFSESNSMQLRPPQNSQAARRSAAAARPSKRLEVSGETMRLLVQQHDEQFQLRDLTLDGNVRCATLEESSEGARPSIELLGSTLLLRDLDQSAGVATIAGGPARIRGRGMNITGPTINLDRAGNRVWIDGAGSATLPLPRAIARRYPRDAAFAYVIWQQGMRFDGQTIRCNRNVNIRGPAQMIRAATLEVMLDRSIDFSETSIQDSDVDLRQITAGGGVTIENRTLTARGLESIDAAAVETLTIEYPSGDVLGKGPGWLETVRMGKAMGTVGQPAAASADSLIYLRVEFQRQMEANIQLRQANFSDRIQATFGPVDDWKDRVTAMDPRALLEGQLLMSCDRLSLFQIQNGRPGKAPMELVAEGNAAVEANAFAARAGRMSYDPRKSMFTMVGAGRAPAQLWRQTRPGAARQEVSARTIRYSPETGAVHLDGMQSLDLSALGGP